MFEVNIMNKIEINYSFRLFVSICLFDNFHRQLTTIILNSQLQYFKILQVSQNNTQTIK